MSDVDSTAGVHYMQEVHAGQMIGPGLAGASPKPEKTKFFSEKHGAELATRYYEYACIRKVKSRDIPFMFKAQWFIVQLYLNLFSKHRKGKAMKVSLLIGHNNE